MPMPIKTQALLLPAEALTRFNKIQVHDTNNDNIKNTRYGFHLGKFGFLIKEDTLSEAMLPITVYPIPNTVNWVQGLINLRGNLIPIYDLKALLAFDEPLDKAMFLILDQGEQSIGLVVDGLPVLINTEHVLEPLPRLPEPLNEYVNCGYSDRNKLWLEWDHQHFFQSLSQQMNH